MTQTKTEKYQVGHIDNGVIEVTTELDTQMAVDADRIYLVPDKIAYDIRQNITDNGILISKLIDDGDITMVLGLGTEAQPFRKIWVDTPPAKNSLPILDGGLTAEFKRFQVVSRRFCNEMDRSLLGLRNRINGFKKPRIVIQRIVTHVTNKEFLLFHMSNVTQTLNSGKPFLTLTVAYEENNSLPFNTVTNVFVESENFSPLFLIGVLNSRAVEFFAWKFVYCNAVRSMDAYPANLSHFVIPKANKKQQADVENVVKKLITHIDNFKPLPKLDKYLLEKNVGDRTLRQYIQNKPKEDFDIPKDRGDPKRKGKITDFAIFSENDWLIFRVNYLAKNSVPQTYEILRVREDDLAVGTWLRDGMSRKVKLGVDVPLYDYVVDRKLPFYGKNWDDHNEKLHKMLDPFHHDVDVHLGWLMKFTELDAKLDKLVFDLFDLNPDQIKHIQENTRPPVWHNYE